MKIVFIRHAESDSNVGRKSLSPAHINLTENGKAQAQNIANKILVAPNLIVVSEHVRTRQTATLLVEKYKLTNVETWPLHEFTFLAPCTCQNTSPLERRPRVEAYWRKCDPKSVDGNGAESFDEFTSRVSSSLLRLLHLPKSFRSVVVFTHGHVIRSIKQMIITQNTTLSMAEYRDLYLGLEIPNTYRFEVEPNQFASLF